MHILARRLNFRASGCLLIAILKPLRHLFQDKPGFIQSVYANIIPFECLNVVLSHPIGFRTVKLSRADLKPDRLGKCDRLPSNKSRPVVTEPRNGFLQPIDAVETDLRCLDRQVPDQVPVDPAVRNRLLRLSWSQKSRLKATRSRSLFQQANLKAPVRSAVNKHAKMTPCRHRRFPPPANSKGGTSRCNRMYACSR